MAIKEIGIYDLPHTKLEPDGYDYTSVPDISADNLRVVIDKINEVIRYINKGEK